MKRTLKTKEANEPTTVMANPPAEPVSWAAVAWQVYMSPPPNANLVMTAHCVCLRLYLESNSQSHDIINPRRSGSGDD